jgi:hypothetical protein
MGITRFQDFLFEINDQAERRLTDEELSAAMHPEHPWGKRISPDFRKEVCRSGYIDGVAIYFKRFPVAATRLVRTSEQERDASAEPFWFVLRDHEAVVCLHEDGSAWTRNDRALTLSTVYAQRRRLWPIVESLFGDLLE